MSRTNNSVEQLKAFADQLTQDSFWEDAEVQASPVGKAYRKDLVDALIEAAERQRVQAYLLEKAAEALSKAVAYCDASRRSTSATYFAKSVKLAVVGPDKVLVTFDLDGARALAAKIEAMEGK